MPHEPRTPAQLVGIGVALGLAALILTALTLGILVAVYGGA